MPEAWKYKAFASPATVPAAVPSDEMVSSAADNWFAAQSKLSASCVMVDVNKMDKRPG